MNRRKIIFRNQRHSGNPHRLEVPALLNLHLPVDGAVREINHHHKFIRLVRALESDQTVFA
jgi:hypothetical protein